MEHTTFSVPARTGTRLEAEAVTSLYQVLQALPDPRRNQGKRYSLAVILVVVILAKLAGEQTRSGVTDWVRHRGPDLAQRLGLRRVSMPYQTTYRNVKHVGSRGDTLRLESRWGRRGCVASGRVGLTLRRKNSSECLTAHRIVFLSKPEYVLAQLVSVCESVRPFRRTSASHRTLDRRRRVMC
jgi:hypothetical protein